MDPINIPYHLLIPTALGLILLLFILLKAKTLLYARKWFWISSMVFLGSYVLIVGGAIYDDLNLQLTLNSLDLNQDGLFNANEMTNEFHETSRDLSKDITRNYSFVLGLFIAFTISVITYILGSISERRKNFSLK